MDFTPMPEQEQSPNRHIPKYVFTGVIVGALALFVGTIFFMYNMQRETDASRRSSMTNRVYRTLSPSPTAQPIVTLSEEEQIVEDILIEDPTAEFTAVEQQAASL